MKRIEFSTVRERGTRMLVALAVLVTVASLDTGASLLAAQHPLLWPEEQRAFWTEGGALLLSAEQRQQLASADQAQRSSLLERWLEDPESSTEVNETLQAIESRMALARAVYPSPSDDRFKLLFLHGPPIEREVVDCGRTFRPIELWRYQTDGQVLVLYQPELDPAYRLWFPTLGKGELYTREMGYWLEQYHELRQFITGRRFDMSLCRQTREVDKATGVGGLVDYRKDRPTDEQLLAFLNPPAEIATWARSVREGAPTSVGGLEVSRSLLAFPNEKDQIMLARFLITVPTSSVETFAEPDSTTQEYRLSIEGEVERFDRDKTFGTWFEDFRLRYRVAASESKEDLTLLIDRRYRPGQRLLVRLLIRDEVSGKQTVLVRGFEVPYRTSTLDLPVSEEAIAAIEDRAAVDVVKGKDSLLLIPPETDLVMGLWRAEVIVTGDAIQKVALSVDGVRQFQRTRPPFTAELRLAEYPEEQIVRAEGLDENGEVVASDEIVLNQQRGALRVRITDPARGGTAPGKTTAAAQVIVPEERRVESVEFLVDSESQAILDNPPWRTEITVPEISSSQDITYLTVVATLDDGSRSEDVRFLNVPDYLDIVDVDLVELYTTVTEGSRLVLDVAQADFTVLEDKRPQTLAKFELVEDRPLTVGITIDTSGSMVESLGEARQAAVDFLANVVTARDQTFAVAFSNRPELLMPRTSDVGAVAETLEQIGASGNTALYDAVVTSLYYFRGVRGRKVLILLSDGEDTASTLDFKATVEYARRSGVAIYSIGLGIGRAMIGVRGNLSALSEETGGRSFFISKAEELRGVYEQIERELRSQYLLAYQSDRPASADETFREVEVKVRGGNRSARTIRGYYP